MSTVRNNIDFNFRSYLEDSHDTDLSVNINGEHVDDKKIAKLLNTFLKAIDSTCQVTYSKQ